MICEALVLYFYWEKKKSPVISHLLVTVCCLLTAFMTWIVILRSSGRDKARQFEDADLLRDHRQTNTPSLLISHLPSSMSSSPTNSWQRLPWAMLSPASSIFFFQYLKKKYLFGCVRSYVWHSRSWSYHVDISLRWTDSLAIAHLPLCLWNLSSPTRDGTRVSCVARGIPDHWSTREVPSLLFKYRHWCLESFPTWPTCFYLVTSSLAGFLYLWVDLSPWCHDWTWLSQLLLYVPFTNIHPMSSTWQIHREGLSIQKWIKWMWSPSSPGECMICLRKWITGLSDHCCCSTAALMSDSFVTPWTVAHQAPLSMGFFREEYWSG